MALETRQRNVKEKQSGKDKAKPERESFFQKENVFTEDLNGVKNRAWKNERNQKAQSFPQPRSFHMNVFRMSSPL